MVFVVDALAVAFFGAAFVDELFFFGAAFAVAFLAALFLLVR